MCWEWGCGCGGEGASGHPPLSNQCVPLNTYAGTLSTVFVPGDGDFVPCVCAQVRRAGAVPVEGIQLQMNPMAFRVRDPSLPGALPPPSIPGGLAALGQKKPALKTRRLKRVGSVSDAEEAESRVVFNPSKSHVRTARA